MVTKLRFSLGSVGSLFIACLLTACGGSSGNPQQRVVITSSASTAAHASLERAPSKSEATAAHGCLKREGFRSAPARAQNQHSGTTLMRYGYPVTRGEYAVAVHKCVVFSRPRGTAQH